jgi:hypothetical protein
MVLTV